MILGLSYNHLRPSWEFALHLPTSYARRSPPDRSSTCVPPSGTQAEDPPEWDINTCLSKRAPPRVGKPAWRSSKLETPGLGIHPVSPKGFARLKTTH